MCRWWWTSVSQRHAAHVTAHLPRLQILQGGFKVLDISAGIADLRLYSLIDLSIWRCLPHLVGGIDNGFLAVNLALDGVDGRIFIHGDSGLLSACSWWVARTFGSVVWRGAGRYLL